MKSPQQMFKRFIRGQVASQSMRYLFGQKRIRLASNELAVTCLVKNGSAYMYAFLDHYFQMGAKHVFVLDNGSTDETLEIVRSFDNTTGYLTRLPVSKYQGMLKKRLAQLCVLGGWCVDADVDEFFDYPQSSMVPLSLFLDYLNENRFDAVVTHMLDMFDDIPLSGLREGRREDVRDAYRLFDLSDIDAVEYTKCRLVEKYGNRNEVSAPGLRLYFGGIRKKLYGINPLLSKHSLFHVGSRLDLFPHVHFVDGARLADVTGVILHYKLIRGAESLALQNREAFKATSEGYRTFIELIERDPSQPLKQDTAKLYDGVDELVKAGFLAESPAFQRFAECCSSAGDTGA